MPLGRDFADLLNQLQSRRGLFSPLAFESDRRLAKAVAPSLVAAAGGRLGAGARSKGTVAAALAAAGGGIRSEQIRGAFGLKKEDIARAGALERQKVATEGLVDVATIGAGATTRKAEIEAKAAGDLLTRIESLEKTIFPAAPATGETAALAGEADTPAERKAKKRREALKEHEAILGRYRERDIDDMPF
jgi:hypothetical protein